MVKLAIGFIVGSLFALAVLGGPEYGSYASRVSQLAGFAPEGIDSAMLEVHTALCRPGELAICRR